MQYFKFRFSVSASCVKIISILLLTLGLTRAAPSEPSQEFDIWKNPCESTSAKRHMRSTAERELYDFSNIVNGKKFKELRQLYPKVSHYCKTKQRSKF